MAETETDDKSERDDNVQMNFLASQSQKERWQEYADEVGFRNLSGLFRFAIEREVNAEGGDGGNVPEDLTGQLSEMVEGMNRIESRMQDLDNRLAGIEREIREDPDIKKLANEVFSVLSTREKVIEYAKKGTVAPGDPISYTGRIEDIATELDEEPYRIEQALHKLQQDTHQVHAMTPTEEIQGWSERYDGGDETRYFKEG